MVYITSYQNFFLLVGHINNNISTKLHVKKDKKKFNKLQNPCNFFTGDILWYKPVFQALVLLS